MPLYESIDGEYFIERCQREKWDIFKRPHFHNCYEIYYLENGEITYFINETAYSVNAGDFIIIPPNVIHKTLPHGSVEHTRTLVYMKEEFLKEFLKFDTELFSISEKIHIEIQNKERFKKIMSELLTEKNTAMIKALMLELFVKLRRFEEEKRDMSIDCIDLKSNGKIYDVVKYLNANYGEDINLSYLAKIFYVSPAHLSRLFHKVTGKSYVDYLISVRIKNAAFLLESSNYKINEIAPKCGFNSVNHFCKAFKKIMGISPKQYRISVRKMP